MGFTLIRAESRRWIADAEAENTIADAASTAAAALRSDYERWSRWWVGLGSYLLAAVGAFFLLGLTAEIIAASVAPGFVDVAVLILAAAAAVFGCIMLVQLWLSGRRLITATARWIRLPYRSGAQQRRGGGWIAARTVNFEPRVFIRIVSASLALLAAVFGIALLGRGIAEGDAFALGFGVIGVISLLGGIGQAGGVMRLVAAIGEGDPLWVRLRSRQ